MYNCLNIIIYVLSITKQKTQDFLRPGSLAPQCMASHPTSPVMPPAPSAPRALYGHTCCR